ncbi:YidC/Oxa1 family membrane protein insertase [Lachnospiraceae bacterium 46-15]
MKFLYEGIRQLIEILYGICGDYGMAIVFITVGIRLCMMPLNRKQRQALKVQQRLNEQAEEIKKKYKNNTQKINAELEKLYQKEGIGGMGCLLPFLQFPIMIALYQGIRLAVAVNVTTVLLPWVPSLLARDSTYILPVLTVAAQMLPQLMPYFGFFKDLELKKTSVPMLLALLCVNGWFAFMLPAGVELYYMVSGVFACVEQVVGYVGERRVVRGT